MPIPFVYRSLQSRSGFSVGTLLHVNSLYFSLPVSYFLLLMSTFCTFSSEFCEPELCMLSNLTTGMRNPALCSHTPCHMKRLVLTLSTVVTISVSDSD